MNLWDDAFSDPTVSWTSMRTVWKARALLLCFLILAGFAVGALVAVLW